MQTTNRIVVNGEPERLRGRIFEFASEIDRWPQILPHYRYVHVRERSVMHRVADFGASRDGFPVRWRARQELFPAESRITFVHVGGITRGMWVEWRLESCADGVLVTIEHRLGYPAPVLGALFAEIVVGRLFVRRIAGQTLACMKRIVEGEIADGQLSAGEHAAVQAGGRERE